MDAYAAVAKAGKGPPDIIGIARSEGLAKRLGSVEDGEIAPPLSRRDAATGRKRFDHHRRLSADGERKNAGADCQRTDASPDAGAHAHAQLLAIAQRIQEPDAKPTRCRCIPAPRPSTTTARPIFSIACRTTATWPSRR